MLVHPLLPEELQGTVGIEVPTPSTAGGRAHGTGTASTRSSRIRKLRFDVEVVSSEDERTISGIGTHERRVIDYTQGGSRSGENSRMGPVCRVHMLGAQLEAVERARRRLSALARSRSSSVGPRPRSGGPPGGRGEAGPGRAAGARSRDRRPEGAGHLAAALDHHHHVDGAHVGANRPGRLRAVEQLEHLQYPGYRVADLVIGHELVGHGLKQSPVHLLAPDHAPRT